MKVGMKQNWELLVILNLVEIKAGQIRDDLCVLGHGSANGVFHFFTSEQFLA